MAKNAKIRSVTFGELPIIRATFGDLKLFKYQHCLVDMVYVAETHHGYISKVAVRIFHRRHGLATRLITFVEDEMKQDWKIDYITVDVPKTNLEEAKLLFENNGYTLANEDEDAYLKTSVQAIQGWRDQRLLYSSGDQKDP
ncbi:N-terminal acetyltransferase A complex catalytic subunit NAA10 [Trifolium repens]|nr:N-terminal acetyltransferase A complex catalytic subunit NAA10 [Trifolium repens]